MNQLSMSSHVDTLRGQQGVTGSYWSMAHCQWCSQKMPMFAQTDRCWVESTPAWITPTSMMEGAAMVGPCAILALAWRVTRLTPQGFTSGVSDAARELRYLGWEIGYTTMGFQRDQKWWVDIQKPSKTIDFIVNDPYEGNCLPICFPSANSQHPKFKLFAVHRAVRERGCATHTEKNVTYFHLFSPIFTYFHLFSPFIHIVFQFSALTVGNGVLAQRHRATP